MMLVRSCHGISTHLSQDAQPGARLAVWRRLYPPAAGAQVKPVPSRCPSSPAAETGRLPARRNCRLHVGPGAGAAGNQPVMLDAAVLLEIEDGAPHFAEASTQ